MQRAFRRLLRDRGAATAVEFAFVAPLFFALVLSTFEVGWTMTQGMMLDRALDQTIRQVRLGGPDAPQTQEAIRGAICSKTPVILDCRSASRRRLPQHKAQVGRRVRPGPLRMEKFIWQRACLSMRATRKKPGWRC